jgi:macrolide transport system ATP-binding/permease protein
MWMRRLRYWMESARRSEALREEMELHLAEKAAELEADGMTAEWARAEARRQFGNFELKHEESREIWMTRFLSELVQDIRYGIRTMIANKAFSALAVLSLALGIGGQYRDLQPDGVDPVALAAGGRSRVAGGVELA